MSCCVGLAEESVVLTEETASEGGGVVEFVDSPGLGVLPEGFGFEGVEGGSAFSDGLIS